MFGNRRNYEKSSIEESQKIICLYHRKISTVTFKYNRMITGATRTYQESNIFKHKILIFSIITVSRIVVSYK